MRAGGARPLKRSAVPGPADINSAGWLRNSTVPGIRHSRAHPTIVVGHDSSRLSITCHVSALSAHTVLALTPVQQRRRLPALDGAGLDVFMYP